MTVTSAKYRTFVAAMKRFAQGGQPLSAA